MEKATPANHNKAARQETGETELGNVYLYFISNSTPIFTIFWKI